MGIFGLPPPGRGSMRRAVSNIVSLPSRRLPQAPCRGTIHVFDERDEWDCHGMETSDGKAGRISTGFSLTPQNRNRELHENNGRLS